MLSCRKKADTGRGRRKMIDYKPFWETLKRSGETTYTLVTRHRVSGATIDKLRKNRPVNTTTLDGPGGRLDCSLGDSARHGPDGGRGQEERDS